MLINTNIYAVSFEGVRKRVRFVSLQKKPKIVDDPLLLMVVRSATYCCFYCGIIAFHFYKSAILE